MPRRRHPSLLILSLLAGFWLIAPAQLWGQCVPPDCDDGVSCTFDECVGGVCFHSDLCPDGLYCNGNETCNPTRDLCEAACLDGGVCDGDFCVGGSNEGVACSIFVQPVSCPGSQQCSEVLNACVDCLSHDDCTEAPKLRCDPGDGTCVECYSDSQCSDDEYCTGEEWCNEATDLCEDGTDINCPFGEFCSELLDRCVECESDLQCSNGVFCDGAEQCENDVCVPGTEISCKSCVGGADGEPCADNADCDGGECTGAATYCNNTKNRCVECLTGEHCEDLKFCTSNICLFNACVFAPDASVCSDGLFCNGPEVCQDAIGVCNPITGDGCCSAGTPPSLDDGIDCTIDTCDDVHDVVLHGPDDTVCDDDQFCNGSGATGEMCIPSDPQSDPATGCVDGTTVDCSYLNTECRQGQCDEGVDRCTTYAINDDISCDDGDPCTRVSVCGNQVCAEDPPAPSDPYRCVRLEWRNGPTAPVPIGSTVTVDLYAVADGCATTSDDCELGEHPLVGLNAILAWNPLGLELQPAGALNPNPHDPCNMDFDPCFECPLGQYDWGESGFFDDCSSDGLNYPCPPDFPENDGDAVYTAFSSINECEGEQVPPACVIPTGLHVTTFKFTAIGGGTVDIELVQCFGDNSTTNVVSAAMRPEGYVSQDVTKSIGPPVSVTVLCTDPVDCDDANPCTDELCVSNLCQWVNNADPCDDGQYCTGAIDVCSNGTCTGTGDPCAPLMCDEDNDRCVTCIDDEDCDDDDMCTADNCDVDGVCHNVEMDCDDGIPCTVDHCEVVEINPAPITFGPVCFHDPDDVVCDSGLFCAAERCDAELGCVFDNECFSSDGNPCPDQASCDDGSDTCGGCFAPTAEATGCRYVAVTPADQGATPLAIIVKGNCDDAGVYCVSRYVQSLCQGGPNDGQACVDAGDCPRRCERSCPGSGATCENGVCVGGGDPGSACTGETCVDSVDCPPGWSCYGRCIAGPLGDTPVYLTAAEWGVVQIRGEDMRPDSLYTIHTECDFGGAPVVSAGASAYTWAWGDADGNGVVNVLDVAATVDRVKGVGTATLEGANVWDCSADSLADPDLQVNVLDVAVVVDAVKETPYPCPAICP